MAEFESLVEYMEKLTVRETITTKDGEVLHDMKSEIETPNGSILMEALKLWGEKNGLTWIEELDKPS